MSKETLKPCSIGCDKIRVAVTEDLAVCPICYYSEDEAKHYGEMDRVSQRLCHKFAKKRRQYMERPSFKPWKRPIYNH